MFGIPSDDDANSTLTIEIKATDSSSNSVTIVFYIEILEPALIK